MDRHCETLSPPAAPSGFPLQWFWPSVSVRAYRIRPYKHHMYGHIAYALMPKPFPLQSLSHARPRHLPVSRRTIQSPRPYLFPTPRTPRPDLLSKKLGTSHASGYRHATADAVGRGPDSSCLCGCATARMWRNTHFRRCTFGSITADSTVSFSPRQAATKATSAAYTVNPCRWNSCSSMRFFADKTATQSPVAE